MLGEALTLLLLFAKVTKRISMKMSSGRAALELAFVTQHRPHDVDPPAGERDQGLRISLALRSLTIVEGSELL